MAFRPDAVANSILKENDTREGSQKITPLKLQKLMYFADAWHLVNFGVELVDEELQCWKHGPVYPSIYHRFRNYGSSPISEPAFDLIYKPGKGFDKFVPLIENSEAATDDIGKGRAIIQDVCQLYGSLSPGQLVDLTHEPNSPWDQLVRHYHGAIPYGLNLPKSLLAEYYQQQVESEV